MLRYLLVLLLAACGRGADAAPDGSVPPAAAAPVPADTGADSTMARDTARGG